MTFRTEPRVKVAVAFNEMISSLGPDRRTEFVLTQSLGLSYADAAELCEAGGHHPVPHPRPVPWAPGDVS
ncbi:hypothetical protein [Saccharothrix deserti]|uniref:hypothetical protein n=1 Tax=Saccharothrix deserti TaxID=2593674 RepID=UPI00192E4566|nr:hypothetical protein [Saccharothrix deserti]